MREIDLPSGAKLKVDPSPHEVSLNLLNVMLEEVRSLKVDPGADIDANFYKDIFCVGFSSKKVLSALNECMKRCLYNDKKIDKDTFEPIENRQDYFDVCFEVAKENIQPFTKNLYAKLQQIIAEIMKSPA